MFKYGRIDCPFPLTVTVKSEACFVPLSSFITLVTTKESLFRLVEVVNLGRTDHSQGVVLLDTLVVVGGRSGTHAFVVVSKC